MSPTEMFLKVFRYEVSVDDLSHWFALHGKIVGVGCRQPDVVEFWAMHNPHEPEQNVRLRVVGTGHKMPFDSVYVGFAYAGHGLVWHLIQEL